MDLIDVKPDFNYNKGVPDVKRQGDVKGQMVTIMEQILRFKERVSKYIDDNYVDFMPNNSTIYILEEGKMLEKEAYDLLNSLQCTSPQFDSELLSTIRKFEKIVWDLDVTNRVLSADELFQMLEETSSNEHMIALDLLKKMNNLLHSSANNDVQKMLLSSPCYDTVKVKYHLHFHSVKSNLREKFQQLVQFSEKQLPSAACATIQVSKDVNQLQDTVLALFQAKYDVTELCDFLMDKCLCPIITKPVSITFSEENPEYLKFQISYSTTDSNTRPDYKEVFENIKLLFHSLDSLNVSVSDDHHVFSIIGEHLSNSFLQLLIDECLMNALPETLEGLQTVSLVEDVLKFENLLCDLYLINREVEQRLTKFTDNFETLFHNRLFRRILDTGKEIMQKDMQDMTVMAEKNTPEDVANNPFLFPRCMVSKSVLEFVKLLSRIIRQDSEAPNEENQSRFLSIISVLINSYITVVPQYHKEHLENLPQQAVLFYCNCMFLHHFLAKNFGIPNVTNLVKNLSLAGTKYLRQQINKQLSVLQELLKPKGEKEQNITISSVHECLDHLRLLESLWQPVLPVKEYNKTMGELISSCCFILNQQILSKEMINSLEAKVMVDVFELFKHKAGSLIKVGQELQDITNWQRLINLLEIMKASLTEITEMWSMGKLMEHFKAEEVIGLIRSLHPNTERRALSLKKIF